MIQVTDVSFTYAGSDAPALSQVNLTIGRGECVLLCGKSGCGKSTLARLLNGMVPNFYEGELTGTVLHDGRNVPLYEIARTTGTVFQNPRTQFYTVNTTSEIAFGCENMGMPREQIIDRVHQTVDDLRIEDLMDRSIFELSGGEKQIIAFASVYAMQPDVYVLDEPSANLDMDAVARLQRMVGLLKEQGKTVVIAEHRLFYLRDLLDRAVYLENGKIVAQYSVDELDALCQDERLHTGLRYTRLTDVLFHGMDDAHRFASVAVGRQDDVRGSQHLTRPLSSLGLFGFKGYYGKRQVLDIPKASFEPGHIYAVIGRNGAGKSTFASAVCGVLRKVRGTCLLDRHPLDKRGCTRAAYLVMQEVGHQIFGDSVETEIVLGSSESDSDERMRKLGRLLHQMDLEGLEERHPMTLSGGQKQRVIIASASFSGKRIIFFDEPTSGLDYAHMRRTVDLMRRLRTPETFLFVITHDYEFIAEACDEVIYLSKGSVRQRYPLDADGIGKLRSFFGVG